MKPLRVYQEHGRDWVKAKPRSALWLGIGLGKTRTTLEAVSELYRDLDVARVLIIAPKRVAEHGWPEQIREWGIKLKCSILCGSAKERWERANMEVPIHIISRDNIAWLVEQWAKHKRWPYDMIVIDESQSFKDQGTQRFKAMRKVAQLSPRMVHLSATPSPNSLLDLWAQIYLLDKGERLGRTMTAYRDAFFEPDKRSRDRVFSWKPVAGAFEEIMSRLEDICMSLKAEDWLTMPDRIDNVIEVEMSEAERAEYKKMERDALLEFDKSVATAPTAAVLAAKLLQMANGFVYDEGKAAHEIHTRKLEALEELIDTATSPVLVAYTFIHDAERIKKKIKGVRTVDEKGVLEAWNRGEVPVLLAHPQSASEGLNLQAGGHTMIWYGLPWSLNQWQQFNGRLHRQGQEHTVVVNIIKTKDTVDDRVIDVLQSKGATQQAVIDAVLALI